jgi:hypothetical protein
MLHSDFSHDFALPLKEYLDQGRVRIMDWLSVDTFSLLETGYVVASIHREARAAIMKPWRTSLSLQTSSHCGTPQLFPGLAYLK